MIFPCGCDEDDLPCEAHMYIVQAREGASLRTADELMLQFVDDALAVAHPDGVLMPEDEADVIRRVRLALRLSPWLDPESDLPEAVREVAHWADSMLGEAGLFVHWDDGYLIYRIDGGPLAEEEAIV